MQVEFLPQKKKCSQVWPQSASTGLEKKEIREGVFARGLGGDFNAASEFCAVKSMNRTCEKFGPNVTRTVVEGGSWN